MSLHWTPEDLAAFEARCAEWRKHGTVREVKHKDPLAEDDRTAKLGPAVPLLQIPTFRKKTGRRPLKMNEAAVLAACLELLDAHPKVAFAWRQNSGLAFTARQAVKFAFKGCSDILGCTVTGRFLAVECKGTGKKPSDEQRAFLEAVNRAGGLGICVDDPKLLAEALKGAM